MIFCRRLAELFLFAVCVLFVAPDFVGAVLGGGVRSHVTVAVAHLGTGGWECGRGPSHAPRITAVLTNPGQPGLVFKRTYTVGLWIETDGAIDVRLARSALLEDYLAQQGTRHVTDVVYETLESMFTDTRLSSSGMVYASHTRSAPAPISLFLGGVLLACVSFIAFTPGALRQRGPE